ncbi:MAG: hypothetical protein D6820_03440 [Lentisphaerae bacterium]|nr:MAG: hypothetical protein D6820_03440 [Lentisphaerota bacterium]
MTMSNRERFKCAMELKAVDRFPVWLKMANGTWQGGQPEPYRSMNGIELLRIAGCDVMAGNPLPVRECYTQVQVSSWKENNRRHTRYQTPHGVLEAIEEFTPESNSWHPVSYPITTKHDIELACEMFRDLQYHIPEDDAYRHTMRQKELADQDVFTMTGIGPSPLMACVEHWCGPENLAYLLADEPDLMEELLAEMHQAHLRKLKTMVPVLQADSFWFTENTSTTLISPVQFRRYCMPQLAEYCALVRESPSYPVFHMCGKLNLILDDLAQLDVQAQEAFTTHPVGDVSLTEGRLRLPGKALIGGTNAALWLEDEETIIAEVARDLATCPHHRGIILTSAGVLPPAVNFAKARNVVRAFKAFSFRA